LCWTCKFIVNSTSSQREPLVSAFRRWLAIKWKGKSAMANRSIFGFATLVVAGLLNASTANSAELATATISSGTEISPGEFQYDLTLSDTGTTTIGTFWFAWVPGDNFMPVSPTGIASPAGWQDIVTSGGPSNGFAIQWTATSPANNLTAGNTLSGFSFDSSLTLAQLQSPAAGNPSDWISTAFVYSDAPFSDDGFQLTPTTATATPEPSAPALAIVGLGVVLIGVSRRILPSRRAA